MRISICGVRFEDARPYDYRNLLLIAFLGLRQMNVFLYFYYFYLAVCYLLTAYGFRLAAVVPHGENALSAEGILCRPDSGGNIHIGQVESAVGKEGTVRLAQVDYLLNVDCVIVADLYGFCLCAVKRNVKNKAEDKSIVKMLFPILALVVEEAVGNGDIGENVTENIRVRLGSIGHSLTASVNVVHLNAYSVHNTLGTEGIFISVHHFTHFRNRFGAELTVKVDTLAVGMGRIKAQTECTAKLVKEGTV